MLGRTSTIRDVSVLSGMSVGTVSRVLSGSRATSPQSRQRVMDAVRHLGYLPNAQARSLRSTRTGVIGLLVSDIRNPFFADLAHALDQVALAANYVTLLGNSNEDSAQQDRYLETFIIQHVDGVIIAPQGMGPGNLRAIVDKKIPLVFVDRVATGFDVPSVTSDSAVGMSQALTHLVESGHRRIGYLGGSQSVSTGRARYEAFRAGIARLGIEGDEDLVYFGDFQSGSGAVGATTLMSRRPRPTALIAHNGLMAVGALSALRKKNIQVGADIDLITFDDVEWFALLDPPLTVVAHDARVMGQAALELLLQVMSGEKPESRVLPTRLIVRQSAPNGASLRGA